MDRRGLRVVGVGAITAALLAAPACSPLDDAMVAIFGRSMRDQPSLDPYENPQLPAEHSVPFASGDYPGRPYEMSGGEPEGVEPQPPPFAPSDLLPPGTDIVNRLENPVPANPASIERGEELYERYCAICHGSTGIGADAPLAEVHRLLPAYDLATGSATGFTDGYIYGMIRVGRGMMPAYGQRLTHFDRWHVVNYVRELQARAAGGGTTPGGQTADTAAAGGGGADTAGAGGGADGGGGD